MGEIGRPGVQKYNVRNYIQIPADRMDNVWIRPCVDSVVIDGQYDYTRSTSYRFDC